MKANKKGISLIVLVITIIVIIILAAAIILSLQNNNPIAKAGEAVSASDKAEIQSAFNLWLGSEMADRLDVVYVDNATITDSASSVTLRIGTATGADAKTDTVSLSTSDLGVPNVTSMTVVNNEVTVFTKTK